MTAKAPDRPSENLTSPLTAYAPASNRRSSFSHADVTCHTPAQLPQASHEDCDGGLGHQGPVASRAPGLAVRAPRHRLFFSFCEQSLLAHMDGHTHAFVSTLTRRNVSTPTTYTDAHTHTHTHTHPHNIRARTGTCPHMRVQRNTETCADTDTRANTLVGTRPDSPTCVHNRANMLTPVHAETHTHVHVNTFAHKNMLCTLTPARAHTDTHTHSHIHRHTLTHIYV